MLRVANLLPERSEEIADAETKQTGKPIRLSTEFDVPGTIDNVEFFAGTARNLEGKATAEYLPTHTSMIRREPLGVVGSIAPWNYPLPRLVYRDHRTAGERCGKHVGHLVVKGCDGRGGRGGVGGICGCAVVEAGGKNTGFLSRSLRHLTPVGQGPNFAVPQ
jgi:hypothetical protein